MKRFSQAFFLTALLTLTATADPEKPELTWIDPGTALREDPDFAVQGEYRTVESGTAMGAQVVALGGGIFDLYLLEGGLPGAGWTSGKSRTLIKLERKGDIFSILGNVEDSEKTSVTLRNGVLSLTLYNGKMHHLVRIQRESPTLGAKAPPGSVVLFDGASTEQWENAEIAGGYLLATATTSKRKFRSYQLHLEFRTPYKPAARGQKRGNSGVYHSGRWETQILDSFGLEGKDNDCGGIYSVSKPLMNMCLPPLVWQTYDVEFTAAQFDTSGKRTAWPRITVRLNGELVHENLELSKDFTTSAPITTPLETPEGPIFLQAHDNPVVFRNIWVMPGT